jgi:hypothetical protein
MTRTEFDNYYAASMNNTEGFNENQLTTLNNLVFEKVTEFDIDHEHTFDIIQHIFGQMCCNLLVLECK